MYVVYETVHSKFQSNVKGVLLVINLQMYCHCVLGVFVE